METQSILTMTDTAHQVVMPRLGLTMTEGTIIEWHKADGDYVNQGEVLFTFESEKAALELEAPVSGVLQILKAAGETVPVMTPVALLSAEQAPARPLSGPGHWTASPKARALARERGIALDGISGTGPRGMIVSGDLDGVATVPSGTPEPLKASPLARRIADEAGIDLTSISGTGPRGQITRRDVEQALTAPAATSPTRAEPAADLSGLTGLRGIIADRLSQGWRERPQVTLTTDADATNLVAARQQAGAELSEKVSFDALLVALVARALREFPYMNAQLTENGLQELPQINIGVAVDTERGLLVPVVHDADQMRSAAINLALRELAQRAIQGHSLPDDLTGGTFTITNLGMYGIDAFTPIINPPECAILGVGRIVQRPVGLNGQIVLREMMALSLSFDHRLVDGAPAARFLARVKELIERPFALAFLP